MFFFFRFFVFNSQKLILNEYFNVLFEQYIENVNQKNETKIKNVNLNEALFFFVIFSIIKLSRKKRKKKIDKFRIVRRV